MGQKPLARLVAELSPEAAAALVPLKEYGALRGDLPGLVRRAIELGVPKGAVAEAMGVTRQALDGILARNPPIV